MTSAGLMLNPAELLVGLTLPNSGWKIVSQLSPVGGTGGTFGKGYLAERGGERAFVKAIDFVGALSSADPVRALAQVTQLAQFEEDVHRFCTDNKLSKVIGFVGKDEIIPPAFGLDPTRRVVCLILEQGDNDLRRKMKTVTAPSVTWKLLTLRDVAQALSQLHTHGFAHLDVKPSNVISVASSEGKVDMKLGDLGRVVKKSGGPYNQLEWPGDRKYAPPERFYGFRPSEWTDEREAADAFMLGSLIMFLFLGLNMTTLLLSPLPPNLQFNIWRGGYDQTIRSALVSIQAEVLATQLRPALPVSIADEIVRLAFELTHPEPEKRGDRRARKLSGSPVGMDRVFQRLQLLAAKARVAT